MGTDNDRGRASLGYVEAAAPAGEQHACPDVRVVPRLSAGGGPSVGSAWPGKWPCTLQHCRSGQGIWELCFLPSTGARRAGLGHLSRGSTFGGPCYNVNQARNRKKPPGNGAWGWTGVCRINLIKSCFGDQAKFSSCLGCWFDSFPVTPSHLPTVLPAGD